ncbi:MAG: hypothetical protein AAGG01_03395 [Planctomycetota bacterium]
MMNDPSKVDDIAGASDNAQADPSHGDASHGGGEHLEHDFTGPLQPGTARMLRVFFVASAILFVLDFIIHRHSHPGVDSWPGFYPIYGFVGCVVLVLVAKEMRKVVMRDEDYYENLASEEEARS